MREIKFRGKRLDNGEWLYGNLVELRNPFNPNDAPACFIMPKEVNIAAPDSIAEQEVVDPDTVGQFTGLLDKNGKEIYEGDILSKDGYMWGVYFEVGAFFISKNGKHDPYDYGVERLNPYTVSGCTVLTNIHENPELLSNDEHDPGTSVS